MTTKPASARKIQGGSSPGPVALVTGGGVRLGRAIVEELAAAGYRVVIHCHRSVLAARELQKKLQAAGAACHVVQADLRRQAACERLVADVVRRLGALDVLVNSAAVFHKDPLGRIGERTLLDELRPNLFAPLYLIQAFAAQGRAGAVVNLLDRRVASHDVTCIPYLLSKKALADLTQVAALALAPRVRVNAVAPGPVLPPPGQGVRYLRDHAGALPLGRPPQPREVAQAVLSLLSNRAITGQIIYVDGGQHLLGGGVDPGAGARRRS